MDSGFRRNDGVQAAGFGRGAAFASIHATHRVNSNSKMDSGVRRNDGGQAAGFDRGAATVATQRWSRRSDGRGADNVRNEIGATAAIASTPATANAH
ncbi:hypothetical protein J5226_15430 [Lysobacter sp. K5869]|uniref:hypothetical protein n=1 Tax=Lysobacter sp. K5869 TaxID=2820808 RepID=UPI001C062A1E|nr:hypothetical protein [Lysobacter sp. K5869]QWP75033.1 hypothetical protein J5226_15430 [Lysobacter sp. K5869]